MQRRFELGAAIALQRSKYVTGQAFAVKADERRSSAECADDKCDMFLAVIRGPERDDLRRRHVLKRQLRTRDDLDRRLPAFAHDLIDRHTQFRLLRIEDPERG